MLDPLRRDDVPRGLVFSLGYKAQPGSRLAFLQNSYARDRGRTLGDFHTQSRASIDYLRRLAARVSPDARIAKVRRYMTSSRGHRTPETVTIWNEAFGSELPASTALEVPGTPLLGSLVDLEAWAFAPSDTAVKPLERFFGDRLTPEVVSVRGDAKLCVAAVRPEASGTVEGDLRSCLARIETEFGRHGAGPDDVGKLTVYFRDPRSWDAIEAMVFGKYGEHCPVVNGVVVSNLLSGGHVEMTGWARVSRDDAAKGTATIDLREGLLVTTGTGAIDIFVGGQASQMYAQAPPGTVEDQAHLGMQNQQKVLEAAGATFDDVFRSNWYVTDLREWPTIEPILISYLSRPLPVPMVVEVARLTAKQGVHFEPDLWATVPG